MASPPPSPPLMLPPLWPPPSPLLVRRRRRSPPPRRAAKENTSTLKSLSSSLKRLSRRRGEPADCSLTVHVVPDDYGIQGEYHAPQSTGFSSVTIIAINIHSHVVINKSLRFMRALENGQSLTVKLKASEEAAFVHLIDFLYHGVSSLFMMEPLELLDVLKIAERLQVFSCVAECSLQLGHSEMSLEVIVSCLNIAPRVRFPTLMRPMVEKAVISAPGYFPECLKARIFLDLHLFGIRAIFSRNDLQVHAEDCILKFLVTWAEDNFRDPKILCEVMTCSLVELIRFPHLSPYCLKWVLECKSFKKDFIYWAVMEAWSVKSQGQELFYGNPIGFVRRDYLEVPLVVHQLGPPMNSTMVHLCLSRDQIKSCLLEDDVIWTHRFHFAGKVISFVFFGERVDCSELFSVRIWISEDNGVPLDFDVSISMKSKLVCGMYKKVMHIEAAFMGDQEINLRHLFSFKEMKAEAFPWFIEDQLYVRLEFAVVGINTKEEHARKVSAFQPRVNEAFRGTHPLLNEGESLFEDQSELLDLSIFKLVTVLSSDNLKMRYEDSALNFLINWAERHVFEKRILHDNSCLDALIRFPHLSPRCLKFAVDCGVFDKEFIHRVVTEAWAF